MSSKNRILADEINCLIHAYLQDSGFEHSSYALRNEARLDYSQHTNTPVRRGELVDLLSKALLYTEVESHWNMDPNKHCDAPFSLLLPHKCSFDATNSQPNPEPSSYQTTTTHPEVFPFTNGTTYTSTPTAQKRKASPVSFSDIRPEKRICVSEDIEMHSAPNVQNKTENGNAEKPLSENKESSELVETSQELNQVDNSNPATKPIIPECPVVLLCGHEAEVFVSEWNPVYPDLLATGSRDSTARIWSWQNTKLKLEQDTNSSHEISQDFRLSYPEPIVLSHTEKSGLPDIISLDWSPDGNLLATGSYNALLRVWNKNGEVYMIQTRHSDAIVSVQFSPNGKYMLSASLDGLVCVWNMMSRILHIEFHTESKCLDIDWLDDSTFVACSSNKDIKMVSIYPDDAFRTFIQSDQALRVFTGHTSEVNQVKFNKDKSLLASCSDDSTARIWAREAWTNADGSVITVSEPKLLCEAKVVLLGHSTSVVAIQWCPVKEGEVQSTLATCSFDKTARLWNTSDGSCLRILDSSTQPLLSISFDPTGHYLATGGEDGQLYIYDIATGEVSKNWPASGPGAGPIYDVNWQKFGGSQLAMCLGSKLVAVMDTDRLPKIIKS